MDAPYNELEKEAALFGRYLLKESPNKEAVKLYVNAMRFNPGDASSRDTKLLAFAMRHPWAISLIDGGLVFTDGNSEFRRRLYVMVSVLETNVEYADTFLPKARSLWYVLVVGFSGVRGALRALLGLMLIKVVGK